MNKSILNVVGVVAVTAVFIGCSENPDDENGGGGVTTPTKTTFTDSRDGTIYQKVKIVNQVWMAENLNYDIPDDTTDVCYENSAGNCDKYGRLYSLDAARVVCPAGWRLPSSDEWETLTDYARGSGSSDSICIKLKSKSGWNECNGTDKYGFSALPGGYGSSVYSGGYNFYSGGVESYWWTTGIVVPPTPWPLHHPCHRYVFNYQSVDANNNNGSVFSIRCLQN